MSTLLGWGGHKSAGHILVLHSEQALLEIFSAVLRSAGYTCRTAENAAQALRVLSRKEFELVILNLMMPHSDGLEVLQRIKERYPDMPVVIATGTRELLGPAISSGAYECLLVPFEREQLLNVVDRALETSRMKLRIRDYENDLAGLDGTAPKPQALLDLKRSYDITLEVLGDAMDSKASSVEGHSKRVTAFMIAIARAMGLPKSEIEVITRGAFLQDIGKTVLPEAILRKPGKLTEEEMRIMREHPYHGYQILRMIPFLREAPEIVYAHHERYDGKGYPRGLKAEEIPLGARIVAVANTLDSMTSDLPYRRAESFEAAKAEIKRSSGAQFDPEIVDAFLSLPDRVWPNLRKETQEQYRPYR